MKRYNKVLLVNTFLLVFIIFTIPNINNPTSRGGIKTAATGDVWLSDVPELVIGETYDMYVYIDCEGYDLAAYGFDIEWDNSIVIVQGENAGVVEGDDGFIAAANVNNTAGIMRISGFDAMGVAGSSQFHMLTITWEAVGNGRALIDLIVKTLIDHDLNVIGTPEDIDSEVEVSYPPIITIPNDITYEEGMTGNIISWTATDASPNDYSITVDGSVEISDTWTSGDTFTYNTDGLAVGTHTIIIDVADDLGNTASDSVSVNVESSTDPIISDAPDISYEEGMTGNILSWTATDNYPDEYTITVDGSIEVSDTWTSGDTFTYNADGLAVGTHTIVIEVTDKAGNSASDSVSVNVEPSTDPIISEASDISYEEGATGNIISWTATDASPNDYTITVDGSVEESDTWASGNAIPYNADGLAAGTHTIIIEVTDDLGNSASDSVSVNVEPSIDPIISDAPNISYEEGETGNIISWTATDANPNDYAITVDGSVEESDIWTSGNAITYNADGLAVGTHTIIIEVTDKAGHRDTDTVSVAVTAPTDSTDEGSLPGYDVLILTMSIGITILGIIYFKRKRL